MTALYRRRPGKSLFHRMIIWLLALMVITAIGVAVFLFRAIIQPNIWLAEGESASIYIPTGSDFKDVKEILYGKGIIKNRFTFEWLSDKKNYPDLVKPGHYLIWKDMSNDQLINLLRSGNQTPVNVIFNSVGGIQKLAQVVSNQIEADSAAIVAAALDSSFLEGMGLNKATATVIYIPNTYEFWWTTDSVQFRERMVSEYHKFWSDERKRMASSLGFSIAEVMTLASIVEKETNKDDEKAAIAGVYLNRLKRGWRLQADPTLVYAAGEPGMRRVLNKHKKIDSPYNTYIHYGLPPGPICIPSIASVDAVLYHQDHSYMFFCAKDDLSGYHVFSRTLREHNRNARAYQQALNENKVYQ